MNIDRRIAVLGGALSILAPSRGAFAADWVPTQTVKIIVPFAPGGSADIAGRILAEKLSPLWRQPVVIDNRPGAGTSIGSAAASKATPDGHTLYLAYNLSFAATAGMYRRLSYKPLQDLVAISSVADGPFVVAVGPGFPASTFAEFLAALRSSPQGLLFGSSGVGAGPHLATEILLRRVDAKAVHVPYRGTAEAVVALMSGQVQFALLDASALGALRDRQVKSLAVTTEARWEPLPQVPTVAEAGLAGFEITSGSCVMVPARTPPDIQGSLNRAITAVLATPDTVKQFEKLGFVARGSSIEQANMRIRSDMERIGKIVSELNLQVE